MVIRTAHAQVHRLVSEPFQALGRSVPVLATTLAALRPGRLRYTASVALRSVSDARRSFTVVMDTTVMVKLYKAGMVANLSVNK